MNKEIWKDIPNYEGLYQASNLGKIKNKKTNKVLAKRYDHSGYLSVLLYKRGKYETKKVHRIIAKIFIPNPKNKPQVNHINGKKDDNNINNLEWVTCQENIIHSYKTGIKTNPKYEKHPEAKKVCQYDLQGNLIKIYGSISQARDENNFNSSHIVACCKNKQKTSNGYIWRYFKEENI